ncbi:hypothetical protein RI129_009543 [Pyrocoelia pectoralis]|uniref:CHK kinase-like domain-containing protein n=1 Tax=Pyrocoelia pectoralis TaxID=417401 RepID=A0AAN7V9J4_9COLE
MTLMTQVVTKDFLKDVLKKHLKCDISISSIDVKDLVAAGNNYTTQLKRVAITYSTQKEENRVLSVIVKCFPETETQAKFVKEMNLFDCEVEVYNEVMPKFFSLVYREKIAPRLYYSSTHPQPMLLLEDLSALNYRGVERKYGLDLEHCLLVVEKLAYLHAASVILQEQDSTIFQSFDTIVYPKTGITGDLVTLSYNKVVEICGKVEELQPYANKIKAAKEHVFEKMYNVHHIASKFKVLNHGDCWINNILFCYENGRVTDLRFVDFQNSCYTSPCLDLHFFLSCSLKYDIRDQKDAIINHYFKHLLKILGKLHIEKFPNREEFDNDFRSMGYMGFVTSIPTLCFAKANKGDSASLENFVMDNEKHGFRYHCFNNDDYLKEMAYFLPLYDSLGTFYA